jgi:serine/threonine protein kinase
LITERRRACLADFGLATTSESQVVKFWSSEIRLGGTWRWMAPELLDPSEGSSLKNTTRSDIYAFACVCYEVCCSSRLIVLLGHKITIQIFSGNIPFYDIHHDTAVILKVMQGHRPPRPSICEPRKQDCRIIGLDGEMWNTIDDCWKQDASERPTAKDIVERLTPKRKSNSHPEANLQLTDPRAKSVSWLDFIKETAASS